ncbi:MAG: hypothetical protein RBT37_06380 [Dissulfurispiraceae bacterium]|jgi:hypothetical protein|nr:hypothetical protein [Dissulfurispiraceae bacterium]
MILPRFLKCWLICFSIVFLLAACGRKGEPKLTTFQPPDQVASLEAVRKQDSILITWTVRSVFNLKGFSVERSSEDAGFKVIAFNSPEQSSFTDNDFSSGSTYSYRVRAVSSRGIAGAYSPVKTVTPRILPEPPSKLEYRIKGDYVEIFWQPVQGAIYNLYKGSEKDREPSVLVNSQPLSEPLFLEKMDFSKDVYYAVRSQYKTELKDEGYISGSLLVSPSFFEPVPPSGIRYAQSKDKVVLLWNENAEDWVSGYRVYRKKFGEAMFTVIGESVVPAFTDETAAAIKTFYCITALGQGSESKASTEIEINPVVER